MNVCHLGCVSRVAVLLKMCRQPDVRLCVSSPSASGASASRIWRRLGDSETYPVASTGAESCTLGVWILGAVDARPAWPCLCLRQGSGVPLGYKGFVEAGGGEEKFDGAERSPIVPKCGRGREDLKRLTGEEKRDPGRIWFVLDDDGERKVKGRRASRSSRDLPSRLNQRPEQAPEGAYWRDAYGPRGGAAGSIGVTLRQRQRSDWRELL